MSRNLSRVKRSVIIGFVSVLSLMMIAPQQSKNGDLQSWFITAKPIFESDEKDENFNIISDNEYDVEIHFGLLEFLKDLFN